MTIDFQTWMRAVWYSIMEPTEAAGKAIAMQLPRQALWTGLALSAVLNVLFLVVLQMLSDIPVAMEGQVFVTSAYGYLAIIGVFLVLLVVSLHQVGRMLGGQGTLEGVLTLIVWLQAISLTLEAVQLVLVLISPTLAGLFGLIGLGAMLWCFVNFVKVAQGFDSIGRTLVVIVLAVLATALVSGIVLTLLGITPPQPGVVS